MKNEVYDDDIQLLQQMLHHGGEQAFKIVPMALRKVIVERQWCKRRDDNGQPFTSFEAFVTSKSWNGLDCSLKDIEAFCCKAPDVWHLILQEMEPGATHEEHPGGRGKTADNIRGKYGTSAIYTLKRLKRDRPDLFQMVLGGALSANAAAKEAGFRKKTVHHCPNCGYEW